MDPYRLQLIGGMVISLLNVLGSASGGKAYFCNLIRPSEDLQKVQMVFLLLWLTEPAKNVLFFPPKFWSQARPPANHPNPRPGENCASVICFSSHPAITTSLPPSETAKAAVIWNGQTDRQIVKKVCRESF